LGGTIALQLAARSERVTRAVAGNTHFGRIYTDDVVEDLIDKMEKLPPTSGVDVPSAVAWYRALAGWPALAPSDVRGPVLLYTGTANARVQSALATQEAELAAAGVRVQRFEGLNLVQEASAIDVVLPPLLAFLQG
jgi:hypothetical protein